MEGVFAYVDTVWDVLAVLRKAQEAGEGAALSPYQLRILWDFIQGLFGEDP